MTKQKTELQREENRYSLTQQHNPFLDAEELEKYARVDPSFPIRLIEHAEREQAFRHKTVAKVVAQNGFVRIAKLFLGFLLCSGFLVLSYFMFQLSHNWAGFTSLTVSFFSFAALIFSEKEKDTK